MINIRDEAAIKAFGLRVRQLRKDQGLSMEKLAELSGIDYRQISYVELGDTNPTISTASAIAKGLNLHIKDLFDF
ncbi:helix-turn-helix transcriptional regulator [Pedobacter riviphilus]|uniref:Helix-turn-helix transcriptional regulator n=1 Tax=Pedobacter riviphilus TaxID=2766984 RepID=A0ABX6THU5_9SPHI|nr:helix-turn-helix transcriptional regulator [Pedobacter riviphilus]QNR85079.1 helix-turn-helix transcriptional regulator [Pedobacter riviphilus]